MKISSEIENLVPYKPGKPISETQREFGIEKVIKLASNENPLGVSPRVRAALQKSLDSLHLYPDPFCYDLIQVAKKKWAVPQEEIGVGNGSNEIIDLLIRIFCEPGQAILTFQSAFVAYAVCAQVSRVQTCTVPLKRDWTPDFAGLSKELSQNPKIRLVFLANPNNPTGALADPDQLLEFLQKHGNDPERLIVLDEAYVEYVRHPKYQNGLDLRKKFPRLVVVRTLSKAYGLAGLRVGLLFAPNWVVELFNKVRNPFNVNALAQIAACEALQDDDFVRRSQELNATERLRIEAFLREQKKEFIHSHGNFVLFDCGSENANPLFQKLLREGLILRPVGNYGLPRHLRWSVGLPSENSATMAALKKEWK